MTIYIRIVRCALLCATLASCAPGRLEAQTGGQASPVKFVNYVEPRERAYTVEVPAGWRLESGVRWLSEIDPQPWLRVQSPDGKLQIFLGDPDLLARQEPNAVAYQQTGVRDGQTFRTPSGGPAMLQAYMTGPQYARAHIAWRHCQTPTVISQEIREEDSRAMGAAVEAEARRYRLNATVSAGETTFTCGTTQGAVFAATVRMMQPGSPIKVWGVYKLAAFVSTDPMRTMVARYVMEHMLTTMTADPQWTAALERRTMEVTHAVISMQNANTQAALAASRQQNETLARLNHPNDFSPSAAARRASGGSSNSGGVNSTLGTKRVCDAIGRCQTVSNSATNIWVNHSGEFVPGPESGRPPDNSGVWSPASIR